MAAIEFLSGPTWQRAGWTLLHFVWQGAAVAALASLAVGFFRLKQGRGRYAAYLVALGGMAFCPVVTFLAAPVPVEAAETVAAEPPAAPVIYVAAAVDPELLKQHPERFAAFVQPPAAAPIPHARPGWPEMIAGRLHAALPWVVALWLVGVFVLSARLTLGLAGSWRWRRGLKPLPEALGERVACLGRKLGVAHAVSAFVSGRALQAMTVGWLRPMVLLPAAFLTQMSPEMLEAVIAHELAHILRRDLWVNLFQRVVETLLFYHPAVWWLSGRLRHERELCCDELAVRATGRQAAYATALEWAARAVAPARGISLSARFARGRRALLGRVRHVLGLAPRHGDARGGLAGLAGVAAIVLALLAIGASQVQAGESLFTPPFGAPTEGPEFTAAPKVSFGEAGLEPLSAAQLIANYSVALDSLKSCIVKSERQLREYNSSRGAEIWLRYVEAELRCDGPRYSDKRHEWGGVYARQGYTEEQPRYNSNKDDGKHFWYVFGRGEKGRAVQVSPSGRVPNRPIGAGFAYMPWEWNRLNEVLAEASSVRVRRSLERVNDSVCYVLDATTRYGEYTVWLDAEHGYQPALVTSDKRPGDINPADKPMKAGHRIRSWYKCTRFEKIDGLWVPMEMEDGVDAVQPEAAYGHWLREKRTEVILNADHGALGSFLLDDIEEGARVLVMDESLHDAAEWGVTLKDINSLAYYPHKWERGKVVLDVNKVLRGAAGQGRRDVVEKMLAKGADVSATDEQGWTCLHKAAARGRTEMVRLLLDRGARVDVTDKEGSTPLHRSMFHNELQTAHLLIARGAKPDVFISAGLGDIPAVRNAIQGNPEVMNAGDLHGATLLHWAVMGDQPDMVDFLLAHGADPSVTDNRGRTPLALAVQRRRRGQMVEALTRTGARGRMAPDFTVKTLDGGEFTLSDHRGEVILLHFWATWCKPCVADAPRLKANYEEAAKEGLKMISLSLDQSQDAVLQHVAEHAITWPNACIGMDSKVAADYGVTAVPAYIFVGPDGRIIPGGEAEVKPVLEALQAKKPVQPAPSARPGEDVVVLVSGSVLRGKVTTTPTHVIVTSENGVLEIPRERVRQVIPADTGTQDQ